MDTSSAPVTCGTGVDQAGMALCAHLPLYVNSGGGWQKIDPTDYSINVRLPRTSSLSDAFDFSGAQVDGADRLQVPTDLANKIANAVLNFGAHERRPGPLPRRCSRPACGSPVPTASCPLVGDDVQKGADFIGNVRKEFQDALGSAGGHRLLRQPRATGPATR